MYVRKSTAGGRAYLQLVESYRPAGGGLPRPRVLAHLGSLEKLRTEGGLDRLIESLQRFSSRLRCSPQDLRHQEAFEYGNVWLLERLWREVGLEEILDRWVRTPRRLNTVAHIKALVFNRCLDPKSRWAMMDWLPAQKIPGVDPKDIDYFRLLRSLAYVVRAKDRIERELCDRILTLFDTDLELALYDLTSSYFEGVCCPLAAHGYSREHRPDKKQIVVGLVTTREGLPVRHNVFLGNTADRATVRQQVQELRAQHPIARVHFVGDRGLISRRNLFWILEEGWDAILGMSLPQARGYIQEAFSAEESAWEEVQENLKLYEVRREEVVDNGEKGRKKKRRKVQMRIVVCLNEEKRQQDAAFRDQQVEKAERDLGKIRRLIRRGKIETRDEALGRIVGVLARHKAKRWIHCEVPQKDWKNLRWRRKLPKGAQLCEDGVWVVQTTDMELPGKDVVRAYKNLQVVERSFRTLKSAIRLRPIYVRNEEHVPGHVFVAVLAYLLQRMIELRLAKQKIRQEAHFALEALSQIRLVRSRMGKMTLWGTTQPNELAAQLLEALGMGRPPRLVVQSRRRRGQREAQSVEPSLFPV